MSTFNEQEVKNYNKILCQKYPFLLPRGFEGEIIDIIAGTFLICYALSESEDFEDMPKELSKKYMELFKYPEIFEVINGNIVSKPKYLNEGGK